MGCRLSFVRSLRGAFPGQVTPEEMAAGRFIEIPALHQTVAPPTSISHEQGVTSILHEEGIKLEFTGNEAQHVLFQ